MLSLQTATDWWKWGRPEKRRSLTDYPLFLKHLELLWKTSLTKKKWIGGPAKLLSDEHKAAAIHQLFVLQAPEIKTSADPEIRLMRASGKSFKDLFTAASLQTIQIPDFVLFPVSHEEVLKILRIAAANRLQVCPYGGGTNVVGAFDMPAGDSPGKLVIDLSRMDSLLMLDTENCTARFQCGIFGPALEKLLNEKGFTLGHFPQSFEYSTLGGWIATHSAGQQSSYYGRIEDLVISVKVATPVGSLETSGFEADAQGVHVKSLFFGSEGLLGLVTEAVLRICPMPESKLWRTYLFKNFEEGVKGLKMVIQSGIQPSIIRYSDQEETFFLSLLSREKKGKRSKLIALVKKKYLAFKKLEKPCLMILRLDGNKHEIKTKQKSLDQMLKASGGFYAGSETGKKWELNRFGLPYLVDDLIERGILVDTVETVLPWNRICSLKEALYKKLSSSEAFHGSKGILIAHISHVYTTGASVYFTMLTLQDNHDELVQWKSLKSTAIEMIVAHGGAISHHHSIGTDLRKWYLEKSDPLTLQLLKKIKAALDPHHILNPGKLFDDQG